MVLKVGRLPSHSLIPSIPSESFLLPRNFKVYNKNKRVTTDTTLRSSLATKHEFRLPVRARRQAEYTDYLSVKC